MHWLVATDLDGTLLDDGYPIEAAAEAIDALFALPAISDCALGLHVVLATSKTLAEGIELATRCTGNPILAFENGAGLAWRTGTCPRRGTGHLKGYEFESAGMEYAELRRRLLSLRANPAYEFRGFGDMTAAEVARRTGLDAESAAAARERMASEPLIWQGTAAALPAFKADLDDLGLNLNLGGRFHHVTGRRKKAGAVAAIRQALAPGPKGGVTTLACGDAPNDTEMLRAADLALVFPGPDGGYVLPEDASVSHAPMAGPDTWLTGVANIIESRTREMKPT